MESGSEVLNDHKFMKQVRSQRGGDWGTNPPIDRKIYFARVFEKKYQIFSIKVFENPPPLKFLATPRL